MNEFAQHIPNFMEGIVPECFEFSSLEDLLGHQVIKRWTDDSQFHRLSLSGNCLVCELKGGKEWWVVGFIKDPFDIQLPIWNPV